MNRTLRIAVADDERDTCDFLRELLPRLGHQVVAVAQTGRDLVEKVRATAPDLVITDIKMPDMDGLQASTAVNREKQTPVILISAHHDDEMLTRLGEEHIMGFLVKPVKEADVKMAIAVAMQRFQHFTAVLREAADLRQALEDRKVIERAKGAVVKRCGIDEEEAFRRLRKLATDQNQKLAEAAQQVVAAEEVFRRMDKS
jgi:response regulator NasT